MPRATTLFIIPGATLTLITMTGSLTAWLFTCGKRNRT